MMYNKEAKNKMAQIAIGIVAGICTGLGLRRRLCINFITYFYNEF